MIDTADWAAYRRLQEKLLVTTDIQQSLAIEAAMTSILDKIAAGSAVVDKQVANLLVNRRARNRRRQSLLIKFGNDLVPPGGSAEAQDAQIDNKTILETLRPRDKQYFLLIAEGYGFREIATFTGANENTVRTRVHRARAELRSRFR